MPNQKTVPLEDELGDVLEKAMRGAGVNLEALAAAAGVPGGRIRDAVDYRSALSGEVLARFGAPAAFIPRGACAQGGRPAGEGEAKIFGSLEVVAFSTPGHAAAHNCYLVRAPANPDRRGLLISGDLVFAGSAGGGYF